MKVTNGNIFPVTETRSCVLELEDQRGEPFEFMMVSVFYVPGSTQRLFSIPKFSKKGNSSTIKDGFIHLSFEGKQVSCPLVQGPKPFFTAVPAKVTKVPSVSDTMGHHKAFPLDIMHNRLGHVRTNTILNKSKHHC